MRRALATCGAFALAALPALGALAAPPPPQPAPSLIPYPGGAPAARPEVSLPPLPAPIATLRPLRTTPETGVASGLSDPVVLPPGFVAANTPRAALAFTGLSLDGAQRLAADASPDLAASVARVEESAALLAAAKNLKIPSLSANYAQIPQGNPPGSNILSRAVTVGLSFNVSDLISGDAAVRAAASTLASSRADALAAIRLERIRTIALYYDALKARALASASDDALTLAQRQLQAAQLRFSAGDAPRLDVVRATVAVSRAEADDESTDANDANAVDALRIETGVDLARLDGTSLAFPAGPPVSTDPSVAVASALKNRPEIASATALVDAARGNRRAAAIARLPLLTVTPGETLGTDSGVPIAAPSINAQLSFPLGNLHANAVVAGDLARTNEAAARLAIERRAVAVEVGAAARTLAAAERASVASARAAASAREALAATELGYRSGASSSLEVAQVAQIYQSAVVDDYAARLDLAKAEATLVMQTGG